MLKKFATKQFSKKVLTLKKRNIKGKEEYISNNVTEEITISAINEKQSVINKEDSFVNKDDSYNKEDDSVNKDDESVNKDDSYNKEDDAVINKEDDAVINKEDDALINNDDDSVTKDDSYNNENISKLTNNEISISNLINNKHNIINKLKNKKDSITTIEDKTINRTHFNKNQRDCNGKMEISHLLSPITSFNDNSLSTIYDNSIKLSQNPFDFLNNIPFKIVENVKKELIPKRSLPTDSDILSHLKKPKNENLTVKSQIKEGIFQKIKILAKKEMSLPSKKYYKFPFEMAVLNDESSIFLKLRNTFVSAFSCAYSNYRKFGESFSVVLFNDIFVFSKELKCTFGCVKMLITNDISFEKFEDFIIVEGTDKALIYDLIMNTEIPKGKPLPFIISEFEFDNGIVYRTKLNKGPIVKVPHGLEYSYTLNGPLYSTDFILDEEFILHYS